MGIRIIPMPPLLRITANMFSIQSLLSLLLRGNLIFFSSLMVLLTSNGIVWSLSLIQGRFSAAFLTSPVPYWRDRNMRWCCSYEVLERGTLKMLKRLSNLWTNLDIAMVLSGKMPVWHRKAVSVATLWLRMCAAMLTQSLEKTGTSICFFVSLGAI